MEKNPPNVGFVSSDGPMSLVLMGSVNASVVAGPLGVYRAWGSKEDVCQITPMIIKEVFVEVIDNNC